MVDGWTIDSWAEGKSSRFTGVALTASWPMRVSIRVFFSCFFFLNLKFSDRSRRLRKVYVALDNIAHDV